HTCKTKETIKKLSHETTKTHIQNISDKNLFKSSATTPKTCWVSRVGKNIANLDSRTLCKHTQSAASDK
ncbi:MAG: hypothetical protein Q8835_03685, partial [Sweet potato little leaf phytoplasma]|nr:hypothetical protein [Sweet potato little leaf phytoplasma]